MERITYKAGIYYDTDNGKMSYEHGGFDTPKQATEWLYGALGWFMFNWYTIDENGMTVSCEVTDDSNDCGIGFTDIYTISFGR